MANYNTVKDEVTRLELAKRLYGDGILWYGGDLTDKTLIDYPQELADNLFEDSSINWLGNGGLRYDTSSTLEGRKSRANASNNLSTAYFDIPVPLESGTRIETQIYLPAFLKEYWAYKYDNYGYPAANNAIAYRVVRVRPSAGSCAWNYKLANNAGEEVSLSDSYMLKSIPISFPFTDIVYRDTNVNVTRGAGLGFIRQKGWQGTCNTSVSDTEADGKSHQGQGYQTFMYGWEPTVGVASITYENATMNQFYPMTISFENQYIKLHIDTDATMTLTNSQGSTTWSWSYAREDMSSYTSNYYGTKTMRIFGGQVNNRGGTWKGYRFKEFKIYNANNTLIMHLVPRVHFDASELRFKPAWYDTISEVYYYPSGNTGDIDYGF